MSTPTATAATATPLLLSRSIPLLREHNIRVVVFDLDQTAVKAHSYGRLQRTQLEPDYLRQVSVDFCQLVPVLYQHGFHLAVATHSDEYEYNPPMTQPETHILGQELVKAVLEKCFQADVVQSFFIVAYNPRVRGPEGQENENQVKRYHMREIQEHYQVLSHEILFFDDTGPVVEDCIATCGVQAVQVDPEIGFQLFDLINYLSLKSKIPARRARNS